MTLYHRHDTYNAVSIILQIDKGIMHNSKYSKLTSKSCKSKHKEDSVWV